MWRKIAFALALAVGITAVVESPVAAPPAQAQVVAIPCPILPCPVFDGSNFVKNTLTEMHTLQQMYDTAIIKIQEIKRIQQMIADHTLKPDQAYFAIDGELKSMRGVLDKNSLLCQQIQSSDDYFEKYLNLGVTSPCKAPSTAATKAQIDNSAVLAEKTLSSLQSRAARTTQLAADANTPGIGAEQQAGIAAQLAAQVVNELQSEEVLQAANMRAQAAYYEQAVQHQQKQDQAQADARKHWNYFFNGKAVDPQATPSPGP